VPSLSGRSDSAAPKGYKNSTTPAEQALPLESDIVASGALPLESGLCRESEEDGHCCRLPTWSSAGSSGRSRGPPVRQGTKRLRSWCFATSWRSLKRQVARPQFQPRDRVLLAATSRLLPKALWSSFIVRPETLLRWHRYLVTRRAARWGSRSRGRAPLPSGVKELVVRLADDNPRWGYKRIRASSSSSSGYDIAILTGAPGSKASLSRI
jgi:hypothetical protein